MKSYPESDIPYFQKIKRIEVILVYACRIPLKK